jgi:hypothetical protein
MSLRIEELSASLKVPGLSANRGRNQNPEKKSWSQKTSGKSPRFFEIHGTEMTSCAPFVTGLVPFALLPGALYNESNEQSAATSLVQGRNGLLVDQHARPPSSATTAPAVSPQPPDNRYYPEVEQRGTTESACKVSRKING